MTGGQKWLVAGLLVLQVPWALIFFPLAALFAITGIFVPIAMILVGIGTLPFTIAMNAKSRWLGRTTPEEPAGSLQPGVDDPLVPGAGDPVPE
jgi:hypothetical protein